MDTNVQYDKAVNSCKDIFMKKTQDYGTSWRVLQTISIIDQIFIKAQRIRTIQQKRTQRINENITAEFKGIVNYGVIGLIQLQLDTSIVEDMIPIEVSNLYDEKVSEAKQLMQDKNHDYGEA